MQDLVDGVPPDILDLSKMPQLISGFGSGMKERTVTIFGIANSDFGARIGPPLLYLYSKHVCWKLGWLNLRGSIELGGRLELAAGDWWMDKGWTE